MPEETPTPQVSDSDRILAKGAPITLRDGRIVHLRYGLLAIKELEDRFGSTEAFDQALKVIFEPAIEPKGDAKGKWYSTLTDFLVAGLAEEDELEGVDERDLLKLFDTQRLLAYCAAIGMGVAEAFPQAIVGEEVAVPKGLKRSRGRNGTSSRRSRSVVTTKRSGV